MTRAWKIDPPRRRLLGLVALVAPLGLASKLYTGPGQVWVQGQLGGVLYVAFWILLTLLARPRWSVPAVGGAVLALTTLLELLQLWKAPALEAIRSSFLGHALIGSTFSVWDLPHYLLGAALGTLLARWALTTPPS